MPGYIPFCLRPFSLEPAVLILNITLTFKLVTTASDIILRILRLFLRKVDLSVANTLLSFWIVF